MTMAECIFNGTFPILLPLGMGIGLIASIRCSKKHRPILLLVTAAFYLFHELLYWAAPPSHFTALDLGLFVVGATTLGAVFGILLQMILSWLIRRIREKTKKGS